MLVKFVTGWPSTKNMVLGVCFLIHDKVGKKSMSPLT